MRLVILAICFSILVPIPVAAGDANCPPITLGNSWIQVTAQDASCTTFNGVPCTTGAPLHFEVGVFGVNLTCSWTTFSWNLGDGTLAAATTPTVEHVFSAPSTYHVSVQIQTPYSSVTLTRDVVVQCAPRTPGDIHITHTPVNGASGFGLDFAVTSSVTLQESCDSVQWSFGDGTMGSGSTVSHVYTAPGTYTVEARVYGSTGLSAMTTETVVVQPPKRRAARH